jgi:RAQPRD family integrative conjugative element protein
MRFLRVYFAMLVFGGVFSLEANAGMQDEIERRDLVMIQAQIDQISLIIKRLEVRQKKNFNGASRVVLNTETLKKDLSVIRDGIGNYLEPARISARPLQVIKGDYLKRGQ